MEEVSLEKRTYGADEVANLLGVSKAYAYKVIRRLNAELEAEGIETVNLGKERRRNRRPTEPSPEQQDQRKGTRQ